MPALPTFFVGPWELSSATAILPERPEAGRILLVESTGKGAALPYHRHKLVLVLSALRHFRDELRARGFDVDHRVAPSYAQGILDHVAEAAPSEVVVQQLAGVGHRPIDPRAGRVAPGIGSRIRRRPRSARRSAPDHAGGPPGPAFPHLARRLRRLE
ncbi:MAG: cryptochrome/photolyase family protein [Gemmatimonadales bacterium]